MANYRNNRQHSKNSGSENGQKSLVLIIISLILFAYAGFISIVPYIVTNSFSTARFEKKFYDATSLITELGSVQYTIKPNFDTIITVRGFELKYIDDQPLFNAGTIELTTTPAAIFGNTFKIKNLVIENTNYEDQILPDGVNKLAFFPGAFDTRKFGKRNITIVSGPVKIRNAKIKYITPNTYKEESIREKNYSKSEVKEFLSSLYFSHVKIK